MEVSFSTSDDAENTVSIGSSNYTKQHLKLSKIIKLKSTTKIWDYFGVMCYDGKAIREVNDRFFCRCCFEKGEYKSFKDSTGSTNLNEHLSSKHNVNLVKSTSNENQRKINAMLQSGSSTLPNKKDAQFSFNWRLCLWICRDLESFQVVERVGFLSLFSFILNYLPFVKVPTRQTISVSALNDIFIALKTKVIEILKRAPKHAAICVDGWTDKYRRRKYLTFTYHYISDNWYTNTFVLQTSHLPETQNQ